MFVRGFEDWRRRGEGASNQRDSGQPENTYVVKHCHIKGSKGACPCRLRQRNLDTTPRNDHLRALESHPSGTSAPECLDNLPPLKHDREKLAWFHESLGHHLVAVLSEARA